MPMTALARRLGTVALAAVAVLLRFRNVRSRAAVLLAGLMTAVMFAAVPMPAAVAALPPESDLGPRISQEILGRAGLNFVLVADPLERKVFFYSVPDLRLTGQLDDVGLGVPSTGANAGLGSPVHSGAVVLPGGRIIAVDDVKQEIIEIRLNGVGQPRIANRVAATVPDNGAWSAVDPLWRYYAVSSGKDESTGVVNLVDLATFTNTVVEIPLDLPEEVHPYLAGHPLKLFASVGGKIQSFAVADLLAGTTVPLSEVVVGTGSHGSFISPQTSTLGVTTAAGLDVVDLTCVQRIPGLRIPKLLCPDLEPAGRTTVPWNVDGLTGSQNFRPRLTNDGTTVVGALGVAPADATQWADTRQDVHVADLRTKTAKRFTMGQGVAPRFATGGGLAVFATVHPEGDRLHLLDVAPGSGTYLQFKGEASLSPMAHGPVAGQSTAGRERRSLAAIPNGRFAFASHGGDGKVSMVDTRSLAVTEFAVPTALKGGGYLLGIDLAFIPVDLMGR